MLICGVLDFAATSRTVALVKDIAAEYVTDLVSLFYVVVCETGMKMTQNPDHSYM